MSPDSQQRSELWRDHLAALPEIDPPDAVWARLRAAHAARRDSRRAWPWAVAAAAVLAAGVVSWSPPNTAVVDRQATAAATSALPASAPSAVDHNLRILDQELSLAYARQAEEAEIQALWATRERLLASTTDSSPPMLARL